MAAKREGGSIDFVKDHAVKMKETNLCSFNFNCNKSSINVNQC